MTSQQGVTSIRSPSSPSLPFLHSSAAAKTNGMSELSAQPSSPDAVVNTSRNGNHGSTTSPNDASSPSRNGPPSTPSTSNSPSTGSGAMLMASRKQNSACDACRSRKVRCNRDLGEARCNHCKAKNIDCTTLYVEWATSSAKRPTKRSRSSLQAPLEAKRAALEPPEVADAAVQAQDRLLNALFRRDTEYVCMNTQLFEYQVLPCNTPVLASGYTVRSVIPASYLPGPRPAATTSAELHLLDRQRRDDFASDLIETYFSVVHARFPVLNPQSFRKRYYDRSSEHGGPPDDTLVAILLAWGAKFSENPLIAQDREESAAELKKAFSQAQIALNKGETEKANQITGSKGGIDQPILTVPQELRERGRNRIGDHLIWRAQDVMERSRVVRVTSLENIQCCYLIEPLLLHPSVYFNGNVNLAGKPIVAKHRNALSYTTGHWFMVAMKHLLDLGINCKERVMTIKDPTLRGEILFTWWSVYWADCVSALYFQRHHILSPEHYNNDPMVGNADNKEEAPSPIVSLDAYLSYFGSVNVMLAFQRTLSELYFAPRSYLKGVPFDTIVEVVEQAKKWRVDHLDKVGVPLPHWPPHWDYISAVGACTMDVNYHANWIILWRLIDEMGIYGTDRSDATFPLHRERLKRGQVSKLEAVPQNQVPDPSQVEQVLAEIQEEALNSALRIAGLADILRANQYLRLDPCNQIQSFELAATMLIRFQRPEIDIIVAGFRQHGLSYEDCFDKADLMEDLAAAYMERARTDPTFTPGSALGLARERDAGMEERRIPELAIAAAALSNAVGGGGGFGEDGAASGEEGKEVFEGMYATASETVPLHEEVAGEIALAGHE